MGSACGPITLSSATSRMFLNQASSRSNKRTNVATSSGDEENRSGTLRHSSCVLVMKIGERQYGPGSIFEIEPNGIVCFSGIYQTRGRR